MKPLLFSFFLLAIGNLLVAQSSLPEPGKISNEERTLTECSFDKEADAVILLDVASSDYNPDYRLLTTRRTRIKILKEKGIKRADIEIPFYSGDDFEFITGIEAFVYNYDAAGNLKTESVPKSQIFRQKVNDRYSLVKFALPGVKVGSIIEYQYTSNMKHYGGLRDWYFQSELPTLLSNYSLVILPNYEFAYVVHRSSNLPVDIKSEKGSGRISFQMKDIAGLRDEPYMDAARDYIHYVEFQLAGYTTGFGSKTRYMTTWDEVTKELINNPDFGKQLNKNLSNTGDFIKLVKMMGSPYEKMTTIYHYVQKEMNWNGYAGKFASEGVKNAWDKKKGSNAEINLVLLNLLQEAGLDAYPLLVSERGNGKVDEKTAFVDQFNTVMAYVIIDNKKYVLDGASYNTPPFLIPYSVVNTTAFIVDRKKGGIIKLTETEKLDRNLVMIRASINENGAMSGDASIYSYDYSRIKRKGAYNRDKAKFREDYFLKSVPGLTIDSVSINDPSNDSLPMEQKFSFNLPANATGDYKIITLNLFTGLEQNPFIADSRFTNIDYGCLQRHTFTQVINLPGTLQPESLPKDIKLVTPDKSISITRVMQYANNVLSTRYEIQTGRSVFTAGEYGFIKEFYKKMVDILNEQVVLRKKTTP